MYAKFTKSQYSTYCTPEAKIAIDNYIDYRRRSGERITEDSPLFRQEFNKENSEQVAYLKKMTPIAIYNIVWELLQKTGIKRTPTSNRRRESRKEIT